jgi:hypothetical protein
MTFFTINASISLICKTTNAYILGTKFTPHFVMFFKHFGVTLFAQLGCFKRLVAAPCVTHTRCNFSFAALAVFFAVLCRALFATVPVWSMGAFPALAAQPFAQSSAS